jgi:transposase-like protein
MTTSVSDPKFTDPDKAREWLEQTRWPNGPVCPHCGTFGERITLVQTKKVVRPGLYVCNECHKQFSVTVGTVYERSHIPLNKWLLATHLMTASKKGMSALQISRMTGLTYKSAWFMCHRIREGMREINPTPIGGQNKVVEADETYVGGKAANRKGKIPPKEAVFALLERDGKVRSEHVPTVSAKTLRPILKAQLDKRSYLMTDDATVYRHMGQQVASGHSSVNHSIEEYVRHGGFVHTNTIENYFSIMKRSIYGVHHHVSATHLKRYLGERDFVYNNRIKLGVDDAARFKLAVQGIGGKRLTYRRIDEKPAH